MLRCTATSLAALAAVATAVALSPSGPPASHKTDATTPDEVLRFIVDDTAGASAAPGTLAAAAAAAPPLFPGATAPRLRRWRTLAVPAATAAGVARDFESLEGVHDVSLRPKAEPAAFLVAPKDGESCPIETPAYHQKQGYLEALEVGAAWALPGGRGANITVADVEGEWNFRHEDLPTTRLSHVAGTRMRIAPWRAHGTAVVGVIAAKENGIGMVGIAPDVRRVITASMGRIGAARAIFEAARKLSPGDVLIVELHGPGPNADGRGQKGYVPMEFWQPEFDAIKTATERGVIVVEAAGNGAENLDAPIYAGKFDRTVRDSGALLIGAGAPHLRTRLNFSNYGRRVDVQGWGRDVATLDYGDLQGCSSAGRKYTKAFAGTSSASPVVAGAVVLIQASLSGQKRALLSPAQMRALLVDTGAPQPPSREHIGPFPNVRRALAALDR